RTAFGPARPGPEGGGCCRPAPAAARPPHRAPPGWRRAPGRGSAPRRPTSRRRPAAASPGPERPGWGLSCGGPGLVSLGLLEVLDEPLDDAVLPGHILQRLPDHPAGQV